MSLRTTPIGRLTSLPAPTAADLGWTGAAGAAALALGAALGSGALPPWLLGLAVASAALWMLTGPEGVAAMALLTAMGLMPFISTEITLMGTLPLWIVAFVAACGIVLATWAVRQARGERGHFRGSLLLALVGALLVYSWARLALASPLEQPSTTAVLAVLPPAALIGYVIFSQPRAVANLRRALPLIAAVVVVWALAFVAASLGQCGSCLEVVQSGSERPGIAGDSSRLYTAGQQAFNGMALLVFGATLAAPSALTIGLSGLAFLNIALQATRAQYLAVAVGMLVLLGWKFPQLRPGRRLGLALLVAGTVAFVAVGPVGERALSGYQELSQSSGNAGYRFQLLEEARGSWTLFGQGVPAPPGSADFDFDLGLPNTILGLGYVGALLQLAVLIAALVRSLAVGGAVGASLAALFAYVLVARPSLPLLEYGPSAVFYGLAIGALCTLAVAPREHRLGWRPS